MKRKKDDLILESDIAYRQEDLPEFPGWLQVRSAGYYHVVPPWKDLPQKKNFAEFFWCSRGALSFMGEPEKMVLHQGNICLLFPGDFHRIIAAEETQVYWFTFDGPFLDDIIRVFRLIRTPRSVSADLKDLFQQLIRETAILGEEGCWRAGATAYRILSLTAAAPSEEQEVLICKRFKELVALYCGNGDIGIAEYADMLHCHRSTLTRVMTQNSQITPQKFLLQARMKKAEHLLLNTHLSIKEAAFKSGFNDSNYFAMVFRKVHGKKPSDFQNKT